MQNTSTDQTSEEALEAASAAQAPARGSTGTAPAQRKRTSRTFSSLRHRNYQLWFGGQLISVIGTWMQVIAQGWLVYQISHSEFALGLVSFCSAVPILIVTPWSGVVTDVVPKRRLLVVTQTLIMLCAFVLAALSFTGLVQVWHIMVLAAFLGVVNAFDAPARQAFVVEMVGKEDLPNAIALNSMMFNGARVVGPAVGGLLLAWLGSAWCFLLNGISFLAVIGGLLAMRVPPHVAHTTMQRPLHQFAEGIRYARGHRLIMGLLLLAAVFNIFGTAYSTLLPAFVDVVLHGGASAYGVINAIIGAGALFGALAMAYYSDAGNRGKMLLVSCLAYPILLGVFAFTTAYPFSLVLAFTLGVGVMIQGNNMNSLLQLAVDDTMRGRVMSLYTLSFFGLSPLGALAAGAVAEYLPMPITIGITALITLVGSFLLQMRIPEIRKMD